MPWYTNPGTITGIIGAITGSAGFVLGLKGYRRANALKALDLRIELKKAAADARLELREPSKFIEEVRQSRIAVASADGTLGTGGMEAWENGCSTDAAERQKLAAGILAENHDYSAMSESQLEEQLVKTHALRSRGAQLRMKYERELALDDKKREEIRARHNRPPRV